MPSGSGGGRGGSAASIPPTANASSNGGRRALGRACVRAVVFHGLSTSTEGMPPPSRGAVEEGEDGKGGDVAQGFTTVPLEALENVLALTASVMRGGSNVDNVGEEENTDGEALRGDGAVQSCNSPRLPPAPGPRTRASRAVPYAS